MNKLLSLQQQAIQAAKDQNWSDAVDFNLALIELKPHDTGSLNRLGVAYVQLNKKKEAKAIFNQILELDPTNHLAKKHLDRIRNNAQSTPPSFFKEHFIEEPGKTRSADLHRLAGKQVLESLSVGLICELKPKNRYISVEADGNYIGALPEDLSFRVSKLMQRGNKYSCRIRSVSATQCSIHLKESFRSKKNAQINSFPTNKNANLTAINDVDEKFLLEDNIPVEIVSVDTDKETTFEDVAEK